MFQRILIANRGEIAVRVIRACRELGIQTVAIYADDDRQGMHVRLADEAYALGEGSLRQTYLNGALILEIAIQTGAGAIHPGYGFLAENAAFAGECRQKGVVFIGPSPEVIAAMGQKIRARYLMEQAGVPVVPGTPGPVTTLEEVAAFADRHGYPIAIKASAGGGGKGLRVVDHRSTVPEALEGAQREAQSYFGDPTVYLEKYLPSPRHVEVQVFGDHQGRLVHLGERDCSLQRRHQKVLEESPAPRLTDRVRRHLWQAALTGARAIGYTNAGTMEFLVQGEDIYFLEVNTRLQVEHPVTEMVTGLDLVKAQIQVAAGTPLPWNQENIRRHGHALECRINAEDVDRHFMPSSGLISVYDPPGGPGVRVDGAAYQGWTLPSTYDSLIAKLITWGEDRDEALRRMQRALEEYRIEGITTNVPFHRWLTTQPAVRQGRYDTGFIVREYRPSQHPQSLAVVANNSGPPAREFAVEVNRRLFHVRVHTVPSPADSALPPLRPVSPSAVPVPRARSTGKSHREQKERSNNGGKIIRAPLSGSIVRINVRPQEDVTPGTVLLVLEAMKMENEIPAPFGGKVKEMPVAVGDQVSVGAVLAVLE